MKTHVFALTSFNDLFANLLLELSECVARKFKIKSMGIHYSRYASTYSDQSLIYCHLLFNFVLIKLYETPTYFLVTIRIRRRSLHGSITQLCFLNVLCMTLQSREHDAALAVLAPVWRDMQTERGQKYRQRIDRKRNLYYKHQYPRSPMQLPSAVAHTELDRDNLRFFALLIAFYYSLYLLYVNAFFCEWRKPTNHSLYI